MTIEKFATPDEIKALLNRPAAKFTLIDSKAYSEQNRLKAITSANIFEPNSRKFHPEGFFSEEIFGNITSMDRFVTEAVIRLNTTIIHPMIFASIIQKKGLYMSILSGKQYARFDDETYEFLAVDRLHPEANTGFQYFVTQFTKLAKSKSPDGLRARNTHELLVKYADRLTIDNLICIPAGLRDLDLKSSRLSKDDINKIYMAVINLTESLSRFTLSEDPIFDGIRFQLQSKVALIFDYLMEVISGGGGFIQKHYGARKIAYSTRNVISSAANYGDTPDDPTNIRPDETMVPMLNMIKCFQPFFTHHILKRVYGELFVNGPSERVAVTNPNNLSIEYITLKPAEINKYTTVEGITRMINQFQYVNFRESPISIRDEKGKDYWLLLVYMSDDKVLVGKSKDDLHRLAGQHQITVNDKEIRSMTWIEIMYIGALLISKDKHGYVTRYPVLEDGSIYPGKLHLMTTNPSKYAEVIFDGGLTIECIHYPVLGSPYYESLILHQSRLPGLNADHDGDTVSLSTLWTKESNEDIKSNMDQISSVVGPDMKLKIGASGDIVKLLIFNLSRQDIRA